jgi:hypothetical protein
LLKNVLAVLVGYLIYAVPTVMLYSIADQTPPLRPSDSFLLGSTVQGIVFSFLGGYVAAWLAPQRDRFHAGLVALIIAVTALLQAWGQPTLTASGATLTLLFFIAPSAWLGGVLRSFQDEARP